MPTLFLYNRISVFTIFHSMKKNIPGILCLLAMPCCVLIFVKVQAVSGDLLALLAALLFYVAVIVICALVFNHQDPRLVKMEHPIIKEGESPAGDAAGGSEAEKTASSEAENSAGKEEGQ